MLTSDFKIVDVTVADRYENLLYKCLAPVPFRKYRLRCEYLEAAISKGFHKKILFSQGEPIGMIEYADAYGSGYPISGEDIVVMNCIWVLRKAKGHHLGKWLMKEMIESEPESVGFATIGLENHWKWLRKDHMEYLGFRSINSFRATHKTKYIGEPFTVHLMWLPRRLDAKLPTWDKKKLLEGISFCLAHPLYHPQSYQEKEILQEL